jgi:hypothetical protein
MSNTNASLHEAFDLTEDEINQVAGGVDSVTLVPIDPGLPHGGPIDPLPHLPIDHCRISTKTSSVNSRGATLS